MEPSELDGIVGWHDFYMKEEKYPFVGRVSGRFYDPDGQPAAAAAAPNAGDGGGDGDGEEGGVGQQDLRGGELARIRAAVEAWKADEAATKAQFPPCNSRWASGRSEVREHSRRVGRGAGVCVGGRERERERER
jgi:hypothetical protein